MKVLNKKYLLDKKQLRYAVREKNVLKLLDHPFLIKLYSAFQVHKLYIKFLYLSF